MVVTTYRMTAGNGKHIRIATQVELNDGKVIQFTELLGPKEAKRQATYQVARDNGATIQQAKELAGFLA